MSDTMTARPASAPRLTVDLVDLTVDVLDTARVLVIDDDPSTVTLLAQMLEAGGVPDVHGLTDARQAVQQCRDLNVDLVLLDLDTSNKAGFSVLAELHTALPDDDFVPVLVLTDATTQTRDQALHAGATDVLTRPLDPVEVILRARNLLHARGLHVDVQACNATLAAEMAHRRTVEEQREHTHHTGEVRIDQILERGDYHMEFQPVTDLATGHTVGAEALARFHHHLHQPPNEWFDQARAVGRGLELEIAAVAAALDLLPQLPPGIFAAINISPQAVTSPQLAAVLRHVPVDRVVLELTEHIRVDDYAALLTALAPLREQGVRIAVDDAGAGYAGLLHVPRLQPDMVKLDIALIRNIDHDPAKRALVTALIAFAAETGAVLVAEGIETAAELATLQRLGIPYGQGYHLSRPCPLPLPA